MDAMLDVLARHENVNVMSAYDSAEAITIFGQHSIDLAIIDADTEPGGGLSLLKTIKQTWGYCHVTIFTSIRDFNAIYTATQYSKTKYLLKSDGFTALIDLTNKTLEEIRHEYQKSEVVTLARRKQMEATEIVKNDIFHTLIQEGSLPANGSEIKSKINLSVDLNKNFVLVLGSCQYGHCKKDNHNHKIAKMIGLYLSGHCKYEYVIDQKGNLLYFVQPGRNAEINSRFVSSIKAYLETAQENICTSENLALSFIVDDNVAWDTLKESVRRCTVLLSFYYGMDDSNFIADVDSQYTMGLTKKTDDDILTGLPSKMIKSDIMQYLQAGDSKGCEQVLGLFKETLSGGYSIHSFEAQLIYLNAVTAILSHIHANKLLSKIALETNLHKLTHIDSFQNWGEGFGYLCDLCDLIIRSQSNESSTYAKKLVDRIKGHIRKNIFVPDHITLPYIADMMHFNPSYLSRLFKKVTNISISDYIMECKLTSAKHLLADTDNKIQDIAESLGYTSQSNFARVFRKATGMTPNDYRGQSHLIERTDKIRPITTED